mmetsp:Transcript_16460/g.51555  ORF Transcript_16460/g.51555 Transcript_16460/m.51555 type:complete len:381 (+) Transcript_16460:715-1857(+)
MPGTRTMGPGRPAARGGSPSSGAGPPRVRSRSRWRKATRSKPVRLPRLAISRSAKATPKRSSGRENLAAARGGASQESGTAPTQWTGGAFGLTKTGAISSGAAGLVSSTRTLRPASVLAASWTRRSAASARKSLASDSKTRVSCLVAWSMETMTCLKSPRFESAWSTRSLPTMSGRATYSDMAPRARRTMSSSMACMRLALEGSSRASWRPRFASRSWSSVANQASCLPSALSEWRRQSRTAASRMAEAARPSGRVCMARSARYEVVAPEGVLGSASLDSAARGKRGWEPEKLLGDEASRERRPKRSTETEKRPSLLAVRSASRSASKRSRRVSRMRLSAATESPVCSSRKAWASAMRFSPQRASVASRSYAPSWLARKW